MEFPAEQLLTVAVGAVLTGIVGYLVAWITRSAERRDKRRAAKNRVELAAARVTLINQWIAASETLGELGGDHDELSAAREELSAAFAEAQSAIADLDETTITDDRAAAHPPDRATQPSAPVRRSSSRSAQLRRFLLLEPRKRLASYAVVVGFYSTFITGWIAGLTAESGNSVLQRALVALFWTVVGFPLVGAIVRHLERRAEKPDGGADASWASGHRRPGTGPGPLGPAQDSARERADWNPPSSPTDP